MFNFKWFLTTPGILTGLGCLLILISIVIFISSMLGKKNKKEKSAIEKSETVPEISDTTKVPETIVAETPAVAPVEVAPVAQEPTVTPVEVTPVAVEPAVTPVEVTPVAPEPAVTPVEVTPVAPEPTVTPTYTGINIEPTIEPVPQATGASVEINPNDLNNNGIKDDIESL